MNEPINRRGQLWSHEEMQQLREEFRVGASLEDMTVAHGRTAYAIIGKLTQMGYLVLVGTRSYHRVDPDPWVLVSVLAHLQEKSK